MSDCTHEQSSLHNAQNDHVVEITRLVAKKKFFGLGCRMMYWSVIGDHSHLEESAMDGSLRRVILEKNLRRPTGQYVCSQTDFDLFQRGGGVGKKKY